MMDFVVRSLRDRETDRFFRFARSLPDRISGMRA
jgi:hypothetical protein